MKHVIFSISMVLATSAVLLAPAEVSAKVRQTPGPYQPPPSASYPSTPPIEASKPLTAFLPVGHRPVREIPVETPVRIPLERAPLEPVGEAEIVVTITPESPPAPEEEPSREDVSEGDPTQPDDSAEPEGSKVPEQAAPEAQQPGKQVGSPQDEAKRSKDAEGGSASDEETGEDGQEEPASGEPTEEGSEVRQEQPKDGAQPFQIMGGGCALVR